MLRGLWIKQSGGGSIPLIFYQFSLTKAAGGFLSDAGIESEAGQNSREEPIRGIGFGAFKADWPDRAAAFAFAIVDRDKV